MAFNILFGAARSLLPSIRAIGELGEVVENTGEAYRVAKAAAMEFYGATIQSNLELNQIIRQSAVILSAQTRFFDTAGDEITDVTVKYDILADKMKAIQADIELQTRDIVGATDAVTNAVFDQVINNFGQLRGQSKEFADELQGITPLVVNLTSALKTFNIPDYQIPQELRALLMGDINSPDAMLANRLRDLGLTKEVAEQAKATGEWMDLLIEKTQAFADMNVTGAKSITNSFSVISDIYEQFLRELGAEPTFGLEKGLAEVAEAFSNSKVAETLSELALEIGGPIGQAIDESLTRMVQAFEKIGGNDYLEPLIGGARGFGQILGDLTSLTLDLATTIGVMATIATTEFAKMYSAFDSLVKFVTLAELKNELVVNDEGARNTILNFFNQKPQIKIDLETANPERYKEIWDEQQKAFANQGPIKILFDFALKATPFGALRAAIRSGQLQDIADSQKAVLSTLGDEYDNLTSRFKNMANEATEISKVNTAAIDNFAPNLKKSLEQERVRLKNLIDYSSLTSEGQEKVTGVLNNISSSGELKDASQKIADIISTNASNIDVSKFQQKLDVLNSAIKSVIEEREAAIRAATEGNYVGDVKEYAEELTLLEIKYKNFVDQILINKDPAVNAQKELIAELKETGKSTEKAEKTLKELEKAAIDAGQATSKALSPPKNSNAIIDSYNKAAAAAAKFANTLGTDPQKLKDSYEGIVKAVTEATKTGAIEGAEALNILTAATTNQYLTTEQRLSALQEIEKIVQSELKFRNSLLDVENALLETDLQRGNLSKETFAVLKNEVSLKTTLSNLEAKRASLEASKTATQAGFREELEQSIENANKAYEANKEDLITKKASGELSKAEYKTKLESLEAAYKQQKANQAQLSQLAEKGSQGQQVLENEIQVLELQSEALRAKKNELQLTEALAVAEEKRYSRKLEAAMAEAQYNRAIADSLAAGTLDEGSEPVLLARRKIVELTEREKAITSELKAIKTEMRATDELSEEFRTANLNKIIQLETDLVNLEAEKSKNKLAAAKAEADDITNYANLVAGYLKAEVNSKKEVNAAQDKYNKALEANLEYQRKIQLSTKQLAQDLNSIESSEISFDIGNMERVLAIKKELENADSNLADGQKDNLEAELKILEESLGTRKASEEEIVTAIARRMAIEKEAAEFQYEQAVTNAELQSAAQQTKISLLGVELKAQKSLLDIELDKLKAQQDALKVKKQLQGFLSEEDAAQQGILKNQINANQTTYNSLEETISGLTSQKVLSENLLNNTVEKAEAEKDFKIKVSETNGSLEIQKVLSKGVAKETKEAKAQEEEKVVEYSNASEIPENPSSIIRNSDGYLLNGEQFRAEDAEKAIANLGVTTEKSNDSLTKNIGVLNKYSFATAKMIANMGTFGDVITETGLTLRQMRFVNIAEGRNVYDLSDISDVTNSQGSSEKAYNNLTAPANESFNSVTSREILRKVELFENMQVFENAKLTPANIENINSYTAGILENYTEREEKRIDQSLLDELKLLSEDPTKNEDAITSVVQKINTALTDTSSEIATKAVQQGVGLANSIQTSSVKSSIASLANAILETSLAETEDTNLESLLFQLKAAQGNDDEMLRLTAEIRDATIKTSRQSAQDLQSLGSQAQTSSVISQINSIATGLIDSIGAESSNQEVIDLAKQFLATPETDTETLIELATKIKVATEQTANNTNFNLTKAIEIEQLGGQKQTDSVLSRIASLAKGIIENAEAENDNQLVIDLAKQLQETPETETETIISLATRIKDATEQTADNTEERPQFISVIDSIRQGSFFDGNYAEEARAAITDGDRLIYSGFEFLAEQLIAEPAATVANIEAQPIISPLPAENNDNEPIVGPIQYPNGSTVINNYPALTGSTSTNLRISGL